jgi:two-component system response regulator DesR
MTSAVTLLSARRMQVLKAIAKGFTDKQIAAHLHISERTIHTHVREIRWAIGANNRAHAVAIAYDMGWLGNETPQR